MISVVMTLSSATSTTRPNTDWIYNGISHLQLQPSHRLFRLPEGGAGVGYISQSGCALVPGPPIAPRSAWAALAGAFQEHCGSQQLSPVYCGLGEWGRDFFSERGYSTLKVGDEAVVPLEHMTLTGQPWREVRAALNRAQRYTITFRWLEHSERPAHSSELHAISQAWLARQPWPELRFGLGNLASLHDEHARVAVAEDAAGKLLAFTTWVPVPARHGWMLDLMRYRPSSMAGLMDFLIARALLDFRAQGYHEASLGGVPCSNVGDASQGMLRWVLDAAFQRLRRPYNPGSLLHFKDKFNPDWQPLYLACAPQQLLPVALLAVVQAMLPAVPLPRLLLDALSG